MDSITTKVPAGNRLDLHFESSEVPSDLCKAAESLVGLAYQGFSSEWQDASEAEQIILQREVIALCRRALDEVELILDYSASLVADHFRSELARLEKASEVIA